MLQYTKTIEGLKMSVTNVFQKNLCPPQVSNLSNTSWGKKIFVITAILASLFSAEAALSSQYTSKPYSVTLQTPTTHYVTGLDRLCYLETREDLTQIDCSYYEKEVPMKEQSTTSIFKKKPSYPLNLFKSNFNISTDPFDEEGSRDLARENGTIARGINKIGFNKEFLDDYANGEIQPLKAPPLGVKRCYRLDEHRLTDCSMYPKNEQLQKWFSEKPIPGLIQEYYLGNRVIEKEQSSWYNALAKAAGNIFSNLRRLVG